MDITQSYFDFLGLPVGYQLDQQQLSERARELQKTLHPDRYAHLSDYEQRLAIQYTAYLNEAVATLKKPLSRAQYLLQLEGIDTLSESRVQLDTMFLMQQMELREEVSEIPQAPDPEAELERLQDSVASQIQELQQQFETFYLQHTPTAYEAAAVCVRKMQFIDKLGRELDTMEDQLFDD